MMKVIFYLTLYQIHTLNDDDMIISHLLDVCYNSLALALTPNLYLPTLAPNFYLPVLAPNFYLPVLVSPEAGLAYTNLVPPIFIYRSWPICITML